MSNENVKTMVDSLASGDNVAAQGAFKDALTDKIGQALDDKRQTVANDWLNAGNEHEKIVANSELSHGASAPASDSAVATVGTVGGEETPTPEPVEIDQDDKEDEQPAV